jgi:hypothetical protein
MSVPKQIVYRFDGDATTDEAEADLQGEEPIPQKDDVIQRMGRDWKVVSVTLEQSIGETKALPVYRVFLSDHV